MAKYHIKKDGTPGICTAQHSCPLGGADEHFDNFEEALDYADKQNKAALKDLQEKQRRIENLKESHNIKVPEGFDRLRYNVVGYHKDGAITAVAFNHEVITGATYNRNNKGLMLEINGQHYQYYGVDEHTFNKLAFKVEGDVSIEKLFNNEIKGQLEEVKHTRKGRAAKILEKAKENLLESHSNNLESTENETSSQSHQNISLREEIKLKDLLTLESVTNETVVIKLNLPKTEEDKLSTIAKLPLTSGNQAFYTIQRGDNWNFKITHTDGSTKTFTRMEITSKVTSQLKKEVLQFVREQGILPEVTAPVTSAELYYNSHYEAYLLKCQTSTKKDNKEYLRFDTKESAIEYVNKHFITENSSEYVSDTGVIKYEFKEK